MAAPGLAITQKVTSVFKPSAVTIRANRAIGRVQKRSGGLVRSIWRRSIRYRKNKKSSPGQAPFTHVRSGAFGLRSILFDYDPVTQTTIIGPVGGDDRTNAPAALEFGGRAKIKTRPSERRKTGKRTRTVRIQKRSSGDKALAAFATSYPDLWRNSIV